MEDSQIVDMFLKRDENGAFEVNRKYGNYCGKIASCILRYSEDIDEALNDTWLAAWNSIPPHIPECLKTFLGRLTRNICLKRIRKENAKKRGSEQVRVVFDEVEELLCSDQNVDREISEHMLTDAINQFLESVPDIERIAFVQRYWYVQSISEIAKCHGFSDSKVKSMLFRIRKKLYKKLKMEGFI